MKKLLLIPLLLSSVAFGRGWIQNEDVKSLSDIESAVLSTTGNISSTSPCITSPGSTTGLVTGLFVYDSTTPANINSGVTIVGLPGTCSAGQIQMSSNAANTSTGDTITFGGQTSQLVNDTKIYVTANSINSQLSTAITNGLIGGGGGSKNYLANGTVTSTGAGSPNPGNGDFEKNTTTGWNLVHSAISSNIPTSVGSGSAAFSTSNGGSAANGNLSLTIVSSGQIQKNYSGDYASSAASIAGDMMISSAFNIDKEDQGKVMQIKFYYNLNSGSANTNFSGSSSNSFSIWIYDVTNNAWIQPAGVYNLTQNSGTGYMVGTFQTTINSTQYQIALLNNTASTGSFALYVDDFFVGPQIAPSGPPATDWASYTPTISNFGTTTNVNFMYRRIGDSMEISGIFTCGTAVAGGAEFTIPSPYVVNASKIPTRVTTNQYAVVGHGGASGISPGNLTVTYDTLSGNINELLLGISALATGNSNGNNVCTASGQTVTVWALVPIQGWSSNVNMSSDTDTRVASFYAYGSSSATLAPNNSSVLVPIATVLSDTHGAFSTSNNRYVAPISGYYVFNGQIGLPGSNVLAAPYQAQIWKNGSEVMGGLRIQVTASNTLFVPVSSPPLFLNAGDYVQLYLFGSGNNSSSQVAVNNNSLDTFLTGWRLSGPAVVAATESVNMSYSDTSSGSIGTSTGLYTFGTKVYDSHSAYSGGTYTVPVSGKYRVSATLSTNGVALTTANQAFSVYLIHNSSQFAWARVLGNGGGSSVSYNGNVSGTVSCLAGDTIQVEASSSVATTALATPGTNYLSIERVGN